LKSFLLSVILLFVCCPPSLFADPSFTLSGVVHDASGGRIPHAHVSIVSASSQPAAETLTDDLGEFRVQLPAPSNYQIEIVADGFTPLSVKATLSAAQPAARLDLTLQIASSTQTVEVTADALAAETTSTQIGETLDNKKIESVPLNGRSFTDLMAVQPGIVPVSTAQPGAVIMTGVASTPPSGDANPGNLSISGQREASNGFRVNGSDVEEDVNMGSSIVPNLDSIDSFRVLTSNFDAEYGNSSGGQVLVTTKAGTASLHGSAFEFLRNTALDARNYFSQDRAAYRQNQFGGTLGGTPFHKSLALFGDYQGTRLTEGIDTGNIAVPSLAQRSGDFSQTPLTGSVNGTAWAALLSARLGTTVTSGEPYSQVFPTGSIPSSAWSTPAKFLLTSVPTPNAGTALFATAAQAETLSDNKGALRADWTHGRSTLTAYSFLDGYSLLNPYPTGTSGASVPGFSATSQGRAQLFSLGHNLTFGSAALNEFHLSYMRNANHVGQPKGGVGPSLASQGFTGIVALKPSTEGIENVAFNDFTMGVDTTAIVQAENIYEIGDFFSRIVGKHGLKAGFELHSSQINTHPDTIFNGSFAFNGSETGLDFADFLLGVPSSYTQGQARSFYNRNLYLAAFAQDSFKLSSELTLNFGVRWDRIRPWREKFNQLQTLVQGQQSQVFPGAPQGLVFPGDPGVPISLAPARNNFSPRAGAAYSPFFATPWLQRLTGQPGQTSVRLGYGIFYTAYEGLSAGIMSANPPYGYTYTSAAPPLFESPFTVAATGVDAGQRFPLQKVAYGASRSNPNSTVDWTQFEPLVGIPAVDPRDVTPSTGWPASSVSSAPRPWPLSATSAPLLITYWCWKKPIPPTPPSVSRWAISSAAPSTSRPPAPASAPPLAASSCSAPLPTPTTTPLKPASKPAPAASTCWPATPSPSPSISPPACRNRSIPSTHRSAAPSLRLTCAATWSPASTTSCRRPDTGDCSMPWPAGGPSPASPASPPACPLPCSTTTTPPCSAPFPTASTTTASTPRPGPARRSPSTATRAAAHLSSTPRSSLFQIWEPRATPAAASSPAPAS